jgi:hypothetical protein
MKAILFVFMLPFTMLFTNEQPSTLVSDVNLTVEENYELPKKVEVEVEVDFGRKKKGCSGFGVCSISGSAGIKGILDGSSAFGRATAENGQITSITFLRASMNKKTLSTYFSGSQFIMAEDFSASFSHKGQKFIMNLKAGKYRMQKTSNGFNIGMPPTMR